MRGKAGHKRYGAEVPQLRHLTAEYRRLPWVLRRGLQFAPGLTPPAAALGDAVGDPSIITPPSERSIEDRLHSWKEIASYLKRDVTTVQRWEKREGMPVHRHQHDKIGTVYASRAELDAWVKGRNLPASPETETAPETIAVSPATVEEPPVPPARRFPWKTFLPLVALGILAIGLVLWLARTERFWRNPLVDARFQTVTDFDGLEQAATISRDGHLIAFLSDRDGPTDIWITQVGSGEFHNLTHGSVLELGNPSIRALGFSPDGSLVTFWRRRMNDSGGTAIGIWAVPILGGAARPYLEGVAEFDFSHNGSRLAYHTPGPGDPLFLSDGRVRTDGKPIFTAAAGLHSHFPLWSRDDRFLYYVLGDLPDKLDIWRIPSSGGTPDRITSHEARVSYPVLLDGRTLLYLASGKDGKGQGLYGMDVERRVAHRLTSELDQFTSLAASADGHRLVVTRTTPIRTFWRLPISDAPAQSPSPDPIPLTTTNGFSPRLGPGYLVYVAASGDGESIWKLDHGTSTELWRGAGAHVFGGPSIAPDGKRIAFSVRQNEKTLLYVIGADGTNSQVVADSLRLTGAPAWAPDGGLITAADDHGVPHLFRVSIGGQPPVLLQKEHARDPAWAPNGSFLVYSGPDIGTTFSVGAMTSDGKPQSVPDLKLTRGARHLVFLRSRELVFLRGSVEHRNLWAVNLDTGSERPLTQLNSDFDLTDFDISPDGKEIVLERTQERSNVAILDIAQR
jgi:Tol biopolymer transport system component